MTKLEQLLIEFCPLRGGVQENKRGIYNENSTTEEISVVQQEEKGGDREWAS